MAEWNVARLQRLLTGGVQMLASAANRDGKENELRVFAERLLGVLPGGAAGSSASASSGSSKRQRTDDGHAQPNEIFLVIHDKEPQDSGSDYAYSSFLPNRRDTEIVSAHKTLAGAKRGARKYVLDNFESDLGIRDLEDDDEVDGYFCGYDWKGKGFYREECCDANDCHDRVHVMEKRLGD